MSKWIFSILIFVLFCGCNNNIVSYLDADFDIKSSFVSLDIEDSLWVGVEQITSLTDVYSPDYRLIKGLADGSVEVVTFSDNMGKSVYFDTQLLNQSGQLNFFIVSLEEGNRDFFTLEVSSNILGKDKSVFFINKKNGAISNEFNQFWNTFLVAEDSNHFTFKTGHSLVNIDASNWDDIKQTESFFSGGDPSASYQFCYVDQFNNFFHRPSGQQELYIINWTTAVNSNHSDIIYSGDSGKEFYLMRFFNFESSPIYRFLKVDFNEKGETELNVLSELTVPISGYDSEPLFNWTPFMLREKTVLPFLDSSVFSMLELWNLSETPMYKNFPEVDILYIDKVKESGSFFYMSCGDSSMDNKLWLYRSDTGAMSLLSDKYLINEIYGAYENELLVGCRIKATGERGILYLSNCDDIEKMDFQFFSNSIGSNFNQRIAFFPKGDDK